MACGGLNDIVVEPEALQGGQSPLVFFRIRAFFHFSQYQLVGE